MSSWQNDKEIKAAEALFKDIIVQSGFKDDSVSVDNMEWPDIIVPLLADPQGWLAYFMLKSDEMCIQQTGKRLWNVAYQADDDCIEGVRPIPLSYLGFAKPHIDSYLQYQQIGPDELSDIDKKALCKSAIESILVSKNRVCHIDISVSKSASVACKNNIMLEHGEILKLYKF